MRRLVAALVAALTLAPLSAAADTLEPSQWPTELQLGSAPNALRFGGTDRYQTSLAMALALRGAGDFPFDTPDRTSGGAATLAAANDWWGASSCPSSVIVVAGDTPADALAAAPLSDPTNRSDEPRLTRVAAADPFFDPPGEIDRVDTFAAPIIVTASGRSGATALSPPARTALVDLAQGGCTTAREAIIVGGNAAVPVEVEAEIVSLGYQEVFRVAGLDRFDTAARIAAALGTEPTPAGADCDDERSDDGSSAMGFYGNAVIEFRPDATHCEVHGRTVVLADGEIGADALAAGWWTSYWQVPVLLLGPGGSIPPATRDALQTLVIDTLVVLGGTGRVPESVVDEASRLATAAAGRFAGSDRYATSVRSAQVFGGWYPTGDGTDFSGDRLCLAASTGTTIGWPDALAAGPWCGRLAAVAAERRSPPRVLEPVGDGSTPMTPTNQAHASSPILLVPGRGTPTRAVTDLLSAAFPASASWCHGGTSFGCDFPGFAVAFGGPAAVSDGALERVSVLVTGGDDAQRGADPTVAEPFRTSLDLAPLYRNSGAAGTPRACVERDGIRGVRWLASYADPTLTSFHGALDLTTSGTYADAESAPTCVGLGAEVAASVLGVSAAGRESTVHVLRGEPERAVTMSGPMVHLESRSSDGEPGPSTTAGGSTSWHFRGAPTTNLQVSDGGQATAVTVAIADLFLSRGGDAPSTFSAELGLLTAGADYTGQATGEAVLVGARWVLAGRFRLPGASGGFRATLDTKGTADNADDQLTWQADATRP